MEQTTFQAIVMQYPVVNYKKGNFKNDGAESTTVDRPWRISMFRVETQVSLATGYKPGPIYTNES
jgi:uncharacterized protein YjdB